MHESKPPAGAMEVRNLNDVTIERGIHSASRPDGMCHIYITSRQDIQTWRDGEASWS
jgi:hypothetical protein